MGKDKKFGFGGPRKYSKENTQASTDDASSFNAKRMKMGKGVGKKDGKKPRLGKSRRKQ